MKPALVVAAVVAAALIFGLSNPSIGQPKGDGGLDEHLSRMEKKLDQIEKRLEQLEKAQPGRWQLQTIPVEQVTATNPPVRYAPSNTVFLLDTQTGTLVRFSGNDSTQLHPKK
jgi:hypothetical protein